MAFVEPLSDFLGKFLDLSFLGPLCIVIIEARQHMLLVKLLKALPLDGNFGEKLSYLIGNIGPSWGKQVHLDHGVAIILECAGRQQAPAIVVRIAA